MALSKIDKTKIVITTVIVCILLSFTLLITYYENNIAKGLQSPKVYSAFNTQLQFQYYSSKKTKENLDEEVNDYLMKMDKLFNRYYASDINNLYTINESYGSGNEIIVDDILFDAIKKGVEYTKLTNGEFNIALGALSDIWSTYLLMGNLNLQMNEEPSNLEISQALACVPSAKQIDDIVVLNDKNKSVKLNKLEGCGSQVVLSLGGIAKGIAVDLLGDLINQKVDYSLINGGASSIRVLAKNEKVSKFSMANPLYYDSTINDEEYKNIASLQLKEKIDIGVSSSGDYLQGYYFTKEDGTRVRRHHILDSNGENAGYSNNYYRQVNVVMENNTLADVLSTAFMNMNYDDCLEFYNYLISNGYELDLYLNIQEDDKIIVYTSRNNRFSHLEDCIYEVRYFD